MPLRAGDRGRRRRDGHAVPALPPLARRLAGQGRAQGRARSSSLPILHLAQLLGAAAGIREDELKFKRHVVRLSDDVKDKLKLPSVVSGDDARVRSMSDAG